LRKKDFLCDPKIAWCRPIWTSNNSKLPSDRVRVVQINLDRLEKFSKVGELHYVLKSKAIFQVDLFDPKVIFQRLVDEASVAF
jgi:hypothetical protein